MERLRKNEDFQSVYKSGKSFANKYFVIYVSKNQLDINRLGVSVSKKIGNSVVRHRMKRLVKETFRLRKDMSDSGLDIVVIIRKGAEELDSKAAVEALQSLMRILIHKYFS
jgi:ribonuclease P protein component